MVLFRRLAEADKFCWFWLFWEFCPLEFAPLLLAWADPAVAPADPCYDVVVVLVDDVLVMVCSLVFGY